MRSAEFVVIKSKKDKKAKPNNTGLVGLGLGKAER